MQEIHQKTNKQNNDTVPDTSRIVKQKQPNRNELPTSENENAPLQRTIKQPSRNTLKGTKDKSRKCKENYEQ